MKEHHWNILFCVITFFAMAFILVGLCLLLFL